MDVYSEMFLPTSRGVVKQTLTGFGGPWVAVKTTFLRFIFRENENKEWARLFRFLLAAAQTDVHTHALNYEATTVAGALKRC